MSARSESTERRIRVMLLDEHCSLLDRARECIRDCDDMVLVGSAVWPEECLGLAEDLRPDVLLIDANTQYVPAHKVIRLVRSALPKLGVVALTEVDDDGARRTVLEAGAHHCLCRAEMSDHLGRVIREAAGRPLQGEGQPELAA